MLLTQKSQPHPPIPDNFEAPDVFSRRRWRQTQFLADQFWKRWLTEYLQGLQKRQKWLKSGCDLKKDDIVLVVEKQVPRCEWKVARVQQLIPSHDRVSRKAYVTSLYKTSIRATCDLILMFRPSVNVGKCNCQH